MSKHRTQDIFHSNRKKDPDLDWPGHGMGKKFFIAENEELAKILPKLYGYHLAMIGDPLFSFLLENSLISHKMIIHSSHTEPLTNVSYVECNLEGIPLRTESIDVVVLPHILESSLHAHKLLRESHRILRPEGHLVITGFNPFSMLGIWQNFLKLTRKNKKEGKFFTPFRIKDWLSLLNFQMMEEKLFYFRPPIVHPSLDQKFLFLETWGEHYWPFFAGAYILVAIKRVSTMTPIRVKWRKEKRLWQPVAAIPKPITTK